MRCLLMLLVMFTVPALAQSQSKPYDENANASQDIQAALNEAGDSGKFVLLEFGANW
jgi:hypothetical protein